MTFSILQKYMDAIGGSAQVVNEEGRVELIACGINPRFSIRKRKPSGTLYLNRVFIG